MGLLVQRARSRGALECAQPRPERKFDSNIDSETTTRQLCHRQHRSDGPKLVEARRGGRPVRPSGIRRASRSVHVSTAARDAARPRQQLTLCPPCSTEAQTLAKAAQLAKSGGPVVPTVHGGDPSAPPPAASSAFSGASSSSSGNPRKESRFVDNEHVQTVFR